MYNCVINNGELSCWGSDLYDELKVPAGNDFTKLATQHGSACGLRVSGDIKCWGYEPYKREFLASELDAPQEVLATLGDTCVRDNRGIYCRGTSQLLPRDGRVALTNPVAMAGQRQMFCAIADEGLWCTGVVQNNYRDWFFPTIR